MSSNKNSAPKIVNVANITTDSIQCGKFNDNIKGAKQRLAFFTYKKTYCPLIQLERTVLDYHGITYLTPEEIEKNPNLQADWFTEDKIRTLTLPLHDENSNNYRFFQEQDERYSSDEFIKSMFGANVDPSKYAYFGLIKKYDQKGDKPKPPDAVKLNFMYDMKEEKFKTQFFKITGYDEENNKDILEEVFPTCVKEIKEMMNYKSEVVVYISPLKLWAKKVADKRTGITDYGVKYKVNSVKFKTSDRSATFGLKVTDINNHDDEVEPFAKSENKVENDVTEETVSVEEEEEEEDGLDPLESETAAAALVKPASPIKTTTSRRGRVKK